MIPKFLEKQDFPMQKFLDELNKKELLFFHFLLCYDSKEVEEIFGQLRSVDDFYSAIKDISGGNLNLKKLPKEEISNQVIQEFDKTINSLIYKSIYDYSSNSNSFFGHPKLIAFNRFVSIVFVKKIQSIVDVYSKLNNEITSVQDFEMRFCFSDKPVLNSVGFVALLGKVELVTSQLSINSINESVFSFKNEILRMLFESFYTLQDIKTTELNNKLNNTEQKFKKLEEQVIRKDELLEKQKEISKTLTLEIKELKNKIETSINKELVDNELLTRLYTDLQKKDTQIQQLTKSIKDIKEKPITRYNTLIDNLNTQVSTLKAQNREKQTELKECRKQLEKLENRKVEDILLEHLSKNGFTSTLYNILESYLIDYQRQLEPNIDDSTDNEKNDVVEVIYKIGYCHIEDNVHYAVFPDNTRTQILNLPESTYLTEGQFVKITSDGTFRWSYSCKYEKHDIDYIISSFAWISCKGSDVFACKPNGEMIKLERIPQNIQLRDNQVVSLNNRNQLVRFYRGTRHNLDEYMTSIKAKNQKIFYVLKIFSNGILIRDIETDKEEFKMMNVLEKGIKEQQVFCVKDDEIVSMFNSSRFYTFSTYYNHSEIGTIEKNDDTVFVKKLSGEVAIVNDVPLGLDLQDGQIIKVDEFNNFLFIKKEPSISELTNEPKKRNYSTPKRSPMDKIEIKKEVLIVGKITYDYSYKMALYKNGYRAEIIDGYSPWNKIKTSIKDKDYIVVVTDFISHENMWRIKDEVVEIPVIYSEFNGANRIVEKIENIENAEINQ